MIMFSNDIIATQHQGSDRPDMALKSDMTTCLSPNSLKSQQAKTNETAAHESLTCQNSKSTLLFKKDHSASYVQLVPAYCHRNDCPACSYHRMQSWALDSCSALKKIQLEDPDKIALFCTFSIRSINGRANQYENERIASFFTGKRAVEETIKKIRTQLYMNPRGKCGSQKTSVSRIDYATVYGPHPINGFMHAHSVILLDRKKLKPKSTKGIARRITAIYRKELIKAMKQNSQHLHCQDQRYRVMGKAHVEVSRSLGNVMRYMMAHYALSKRNPSSCSTKWSLPMGFRRCAKSKGLKGATTLVKGDIVRLGGGVEYWRDKCQAYELPYKSRLGGLLIEREDFTALLLLTMHSKSNTIFNVGKVHRLIEKTEFLGPEKTYILGRTCSEIGF